MPRPYNRAHIGDVSKIDTTSFEVNVETGGTAHFVCSPPRLHEWSLSDSKSRACFIQWRRQSQGTTGINREGERQIREMGLGWRISLIIM